MKTRRKTSVFRACRQLISSRYLSLELCVSIPGALCSDSTCSRVLLRWCITEPAVRTRSNKHTIVTHWRFHENLSIYGNYNRVWSHWYPCFILLVTSALRFKTTEDLLLGWFIACTQWIPQIHLWCNMADKPFWPTYLYTSIGGTRVQYQVWGWLTACDKTDALPNELCRLGRVVELL